MTEVKKPLWKVALNFIYTLLGGLKSAGVFSKGQGPNIPPK